MPMPETTSFPSGHSASAFAFAEAVGVSLPGLGSRSAGSPPPSRTRVRHTGVHYPGDVVVGSLIGTTIGQATAQRSGRESSPRRPRSMSLLF